ncbi:unnamed protein product [Cylindrotheca closterium]|uniref:Uncharacterized protein n=1 Tax=Cylindrotheca closterium TaxID=2856 RepID=A0AAD2CKZ8_9STRA|nr:unnamed protein product [Cylindrotheca closterium]
MSRRRRIEKSKLTFTGTYSSLNCTGTETSAVHQTEKKVELLRQALPYWAGLYLIASWIYFMIPALKGLPFGDSTHNRSWQSCWTFSKNESLRRLMSLKVEAFALQQEHRYCKAFDDNHAPYL